jgi:hypothetical protein
MRTNKVRMYPNWCMHRHGARVLVAFVFETKKSGGSSRKKQAQTRVEEGGTHPAK